MERPSFASGFVQPFVWLLSRESRCPPELLDRFRSLTAAERVALEDSHVLTETWVEHSGDANVGLRAGRMACLGLGGVLDYAMNSAPSIKDGMALAHRYIRLFGDLLETALEVNGNRALIRLDKRVPWPRSVADFTMSAWFMNHIRAQLGQAPEVECWFAHRAPSDLTAYEGLFAPAKLKFGAPCYGFSFDVDFLDRPLPGSDPALHAIHRERLQVRYTALFESQKLSMRVRDLVSEQLPVTRPTAHEIARRLQISRRTLARRLEAEGTTFGSQVNAVRERLAKHYVSCPELEFSEISELLGFSHAQAFHRAFKRWTGVTPGYYRDLRRTQPSATAVESAPDRVSGE